MTAFENQVLAKIAMKKRKLTDFARPVVLVAGAAVDGATTEPGVDAANEAQGEGDAKPAQDSVASLW